MIETGFEANATQELEGRHARSGRASPGDPHRHLGIFEALNSGSRWWN
jgi:hypothetical protein